MSQRTWAFCLSFLLLAAVVPARAIIVVTDAKGPGGAPFTVTQIYATDAAYTGNTTYSASGAQFEGSWQVGAGTAVAPNWFLTSSHLLGTVGNIFTFQNTSYTTIKSVDVGNGMTLWEVNKPFSTYAPIFANNDPSLQAGAHSVQGATTSDFGFGVAAGIRTGPPGTPIFSSPPVTGPGGGIQGYQWIGGTGQLSWGASSVFAYAMDNSGGTYLTTAFTPSLGAVFTSSPSGNVMMSSTVATGDSGGGLFAFVNGQWQLVGVNFGVDGPYTAGPNSSPQGTYFAAMYDTNGFTGGNGVISTQLSYANNITSTVALAISTAVPEPASALLLAAGIGAIGVVRRRARRRPRPTAPA